jgi:heme-degrading monooxygenase HmoA
MPLTRREVVQTASLGAVLASFLEAAPAASAPAAGQDTKIVNLDDRVTFKQQLEHNIGPVVLMRTFLVLPDRVDDFLEGFKKQFAIMRKQPGLISAQLHRGIAGSSLFMNYIVWESTDAFRHGYQSPESRRS